ncbi:MAG: ATP-binding protein [Elusimicrobia bacterium]|nr:ATP-binding protein [Elusimicrobiota bacterium]
MIKREHSEIFRIKLKTFPVVFITGPRQCGKTTFVKNELKKWRYLDMEKPSDFQALQSDLQGFLERNTSNLVLDEAQRLPEIFPALRAIIDSARRPGMFVITGSSNPALKKTISESLAGRVGMVEMSPFSMKELSTRPKFFFQRWFWGGFPPLYEFASGKQRILWLSDYLSAILERDIPRLGFRIEAPGLYKFLQMLAHTHGNILNLSELANAMSISHHTVAHYLDIFEGIFLIRRMPPYFVNIGKRLVKSPKLYIRDTGVFHFLLGLKGPRELDVHPRVGASWEGFIIEEITQRAARRHPMARFFFWRTQAGVEVDLVIENGAKKTVIEIKRSVPGAKALAAVRQCAEDINAANSIVIHSGKETYAYKNGIKILPWKAILDEKFYRDL